MPAASLVAIDKMFEMGKFDLGDSSAAMYPVRQAEQFSLAKIERFRLLGSNELPVYDLGETRATSQTLPRIIEYSVLAIMIAAGIGCSIAVVLWLTG